MTIAQLTRREAVLEAIAEYDEMGATAFLAQYGYAPARSYFLEHDGRQYDSKAIVGVAVGKEHPDLGPLRSSDFSGGDKTVRRKLEELGFTLSKSEEGSDFGSSAALAVLEAILGAPPLRATKYVAVWRTAAGRELALQLGQQVARIWLEIQPPLDDGWQADQYAGHESRNSNLKANAPQLAQPFTAWLAQVVDGSDLERLAAWYQAQPAQPLDLSELDRFRSVFIEQMEGFSTFAETDSTYGKAERAYKDELTDLFAAEILPLVSGPLANDDAAAALTTAYHSILTRKLRAHNAPQNLVGWQAVDRLKSGDPERSARLGRALWQLLSGPGDRIARITSFIDEVGETLRAMGATGPRGIARLLGSLALMLQDPQAAVVVRSDLFEKAVTQLMRRPFPKSPDDPGRVAVGLELANLLFVHLRDSWGWEPRDLIDVQGFLWVALMYDPEAGVQGSSLAELFQTMLGQFSAARLQPFREVKALWSTMDQLKQRIEALPSVQSRPHIRASWSLGKGVWAKVPWIGLLNPAVTTTTQEGLYAVFLFAEDLERIYLSLIQGMASLVNEQGRAAASATLIGRSASYRNQVPELATAGFSLSDDLDLSTDAWRAKNYQAGTIGYLALEPSALPSDEDFNEALEALLSAYDQLVENAKLDAEEAKEERPCWFVGASWAGTDDQTQRFLRDGIWENGYDEGPTLDLVRQMAVGDRIAIKSSYTRKHDLPFALPPGKKSASVLQIKATGIITANEGDGRKVQVAWNLPAEPREWFIWTNRDTIWRLTSARPAARQLIAFAFDGAPQDYGWFLSDPAVRDDETVEIEVSTAKPFTIDDALRGLFLPRPEFERILAIWRGKTNLIIQGAPGVGKTFIAQRLAYALMGQEDESRVEMVQFHQSYGYEDFIQGFRPTGSGFTLQDGVFFRFARRALEDHARPYVFIIDEINRGNLSKIFGELMMLIEHDKRSSKWKTRLAYSREEDPKFWLPENLFILGMMNTADRSLSLVDYALRRRFAFVTLEPAFESDGFTAHLLEQGVPRGIVDHVVSRMSELNELIAADKANLGPGFRIGHSFFVPSRNFAYDEGWLERVIDTEIRPLLEEYWFDEPQKANGWRQRLLDLG